MAQPGTGPGTIPGTGIDPAITGEPPEERTDDRSQGGGLSRTGRNRPVTADE
jgi:hypothetical protein